MVNENIDYSYHPLAEYICRLENNDTLLDDSPLNVCLLYTSPSPRD